MTREQIVVLRILDDEDGRTWWEALRLPDPAKWSLSDTFERNCFAQVEIEEEVKRGE